jgi:hypothetical protein
VSSNATTWSKSGTPSTKIKKRTPSPPPASPFETLP